jgi:hypothetical protein
VNPGPSRRRRAGTRTLGGTRSVLVQCWTSLEFRALLTQVADRLDKSASQIVREAVWSHLLRVASPAELDEYRAGARAAER